MILSVSRRTDVPRFYFDWFLNRLKEGVVLVRNPVNLHQVSEIELTPQTIDCIVFWTKNPQPMLGKLASLGDYPYYVQFTLNPYGKEMECNLPDKDRLLELFKRLADRIGPERVVWRYSPVILSESYTRQVHLDFFAQTAQALRGYTRQCKLSFLDFYSKIKKRMTAMGALQSAEEQKNSLAKEFFVIAAEQKIDVSACGNLDLAAAGIPPAKCIDDGLISRMTGYGFDLKKDTGQRPECHCVSSVDIGAYDTCCNGCKYCYANASFEAVARKIKEYDPKSPLLCGSLAPEDIVKHRVVRLEREEQTRLF